jgi:hypothetical protein
MSGSHIDFYISFDTHEKANRGLIFSFALEKFQSADVLNPGAWKNSAVPTDSRSPTRVSAARNGPEPGRIQCGR